MDPSQDAVDAMGRDLAAALRREYSAAYAEASARAASYLSSFKAEDAVQARRMKEGEIGKREYARWRQGRMCAGQRWEDLVSTLGRDLADVDSKAAALMHEAAQGAYAEGHNFGTFQVEGAAGTDTGYSLYDKDTVRGLLQKDAAVLPAPRINIPAARRWNSQHVASALTQGVLQGDSVNDVAKRLREVTDMGYRASVRNARTALTGAENKGRTDSYDRVSSMGLKVRKQWLSTIDSRTRHSHIAMDGQVRDNDKPFSNRCRYPGDSAGPPWEVYNCRCTTVPAIEGINQSGADRKGASEYEVWKKSAGRASTEPAAPSTDPAPVRYGEFRSLSYVDDGMGAHAGDGSDLDPVRMVAEDTGFDDTRARQVIQDVSQWVGNDYTKIRAHDPSTEDVRERLEEFLKASPKYEGTVWRGVGLERADAEGVLRTLRTGGEIDQRGMSSWATESDWATEFAEMNVERRDDGVSIIFHLDENRSGVSIKHVASIDNDEVVAPEGARYVLSGKIERVDDPYDGDYWLVPVREVY